MKNTALTSVHESLGAKMVPYAGYNMPVSYQGINAEPETRKVTTLRKMKQTLKQTRIPTH